MWSGTSLSDKWEIPLGTGVFHSAYTELGISEKDASLGLCVWAISHQRQTQHFPLISLAATYDSMLGAPPTSLFLASTLP